MYLYQSNTSTTNEKTDISHKKYGYGRLCCLLTNMDIALIEKNEQQESEKRGMLSPRSRDIYLRDPDVGISFSHAANETIIAGNHKIKKKVQIYEGIW